MPGIFGIISPKSSEKNKQDLDIMLNSMMHEQFYASGQFTNDTLGVYAGWVCHKDSFCDCMPVWNEKKNIALVFFGENFTDVELFNQLKSKHHKFDHSNASYLVHLYEEKEIDFLKDLNGWFNGILIDLQKNKVILFNDRYGMQKVFYHENSDGFYFASEAKALLKLLPNLRKLEIKGVGELLKCGCVLENRTLFKNIFLLPSSSAWIFQKNTVEKGCYFSIDVWENQSWLDEDFFYDKLRDTLTRVIPRYFDTKQKIAISLTGGLDTRIILANFQMPAKKYPCYTFNGMYRDCYDAKIARKVAATLLQDHYTISIDKSFLTNFAEYAQKTVYITDGYVDTTGAAELYANMNARTIAPIRMTGNFGSEVLRDVRYLKAGSFSNKAFHADIAASIQNTIHTLDIYNHKYSNPLSFTLFAEIPWHENNRLVCEQSQLIMRTPYLDNDLVSLLYRAPVNARRTKELSLRLISDGNPELAKIPTDKGYGGNLIYPARKLSQYFSEFLAKAEYAYSYGMPHWLAQIDNAFNFIRLEKLFTGRHKFYHFRLWYRDDLADYIKVMLLDKKTLTRPYLIKKEVEEIVENHTKGYRNYTTEITQLLTVELIQRYLIEQ